ncbi:MAG: MHYT domain-containing protein [Pseudomonadota bacterium]
MDLTTLLRLFTTPADPSLLTYGLYDPALVTLSVLVAIFSSWMGLQIAGQASANRAQRTIVLLTGSAALGSGVWAMHFIGMLAFNLCTRVDYDPTITILSLLPSVAASFVALSLIGRQRIGIGALLVGGVLVGAGIGAMHYAGMAGMRMNLALRYDPTMFALSIVVAVVLSTLALWVRFGLRSLRRELNESRLLLISAVVMGCAIAGMHYTGMAAARFIGRVDPGATGSSNGTFVALAITLITVAFTVFVLAANGLLRYRQLYLELSRSEAWMRALLTTTVDGVITVDSAGTIQEFNSSAERIFGWTRAEIVGRNVSLLMADPGRSESDGLLNYLRSRDDDIVARGSEVLGLRKDGAVVPIRRALGHARLADQDLFVCFITDISERRAMVQALRASEQQFRSLIGNLPGVSYRALLASAQLVFISDAVERVAGYPAADFLGGPARRDFRGLIHGADRARVAQAVSEAIAADQPYLVEYRLLHADGSTRWLWENGSGVRNEGGEVEWLDGVILDISERRAMEEALRLAKEKAEQAAAARASFVANMSHEIRTPMNAILGFTDVLLDSELSPDQQRHLNTVRGAGRSLLRLLNEVLDTAKLEKGAVELELTDFNLLDLIDELSSTLGANARAKGLLVDLRYDPELPACLHGDELRMRQVLTNLLDNAIKFTAAGSVVLAVGRRDDMLHLLVQDTGIGIAPERLAAIFEPFTQADASMTRRYGGTGLGTTISKQLVDLMGGRIWAESVAGQGSSFHVLLPLVPARFAPLQARARTPAVLPPLRILAADDVPQNLDLLALMLTRRGHLLSTASDGAAAVQRAAEGEYDLILMDVQMPQMDGLTATGAIHAAAEQAGRKKLPVVAMTASVLDEHRRACKEAGMEGFVSKPIDWPLLSHEIARVLGLAAGPSAAGADAEAHVLNRRAGQRRWSGRADAFREALAHFVRDYASLGAQLEAALDGPDAGALAHKGRGVAANLGLERLAGALARLEQDCADGARGQAAATLALVQAELDAALAAIGPGEAAAEAPGAAPGATDTAQARRCASRLAQALARGALDDAALAELAGALGGSAAVAAVHAAIADFDFALAQSRVEALLAELPEPNTTENSQ